MFKRITLLLTISQGTFSKTRSFNSEHLYTIPHINFSGFDEVIIVCTDPKPNSDFFKFIDSMIERLLQELGTKPKIILTGGLSPIIQPALNLNAQYEENLTLVGLEEIFNLNN